MVTQEYEVSISLYYSWCYDTLVTISFSLVYFKVTNYHVDIFQAIYNDMSKLVTGSYVGVLEGDANNIVDLITKTYAEITSSVRVKVKDYIYYGNKNNHQL